MSRAAAIASHAARTWLRYAVPLTLLSGLVFAPWAIFLVLRFHPTADQAGAQGCVLLGWEIVATAWVPQIWLVAAAAWLARERPGQLRALGGGIVQLVRYAVPWFVAAAAIGVGLVVVVVPGLVLLALLALTGASRERRVPGALTESVAAARTQLAAVVIAVVAVVALDLAIGAIAQHVLLAFPVPKQPTPAQLAGFRAFVPMVLLALAAVSSLPATLLASLRED